MEGVGAPRDAGAAMTTACLWCGGPFEPRRDGGSAQRYCAPACRRAFDKAARTWVRQAIECGTLTVADLHEGAGTARAALRAFGCRPGPSCRAGTCHTRAGTITSPEAKGSTMKGLGSSRHSTYRERKARGARIVQIEVRGEHIAALARNGYLKPADASSRSSIGRALAAFIDDTLGVVRAHEACGASSDAWAGGECQAPGSHVPQATVAARELGGTTGPSGRPQISARPEPPKAVPLMSRPHGVVPAGLEAELFPGEPDAPAQPVPRRPCAAEDLGAGLFDDRDGVPPWEDHGPNTGSKSTTGTWPSNAAIKDEPAFKPIPKPNERWPSDAEIVAAYPSIFAAYYVASLRDRRMRGWWTDRHSQMVDDRDPIPEDFMRPAEALRMREIGDPLEALSRKRGDP